MAQMVRNDSSSVISSLQMDYSDSDEEENNTSKNTSHNDEVMETENKETAHGDGEKLAENQSTSNTDREKGAESSGSNQIVSNVPTDLEGHSSKEPLSHSQSDETNISKVNASDISDKEAEGTPTDFISDDEEGDHNSHHQHSHHHRHQSRKAEEKVSSLAIDPVSTDSPSSLPSANAAKKATRLVSYGPDEDVDDDEDEDSEPEEEVEPQESMDNSPEGEPIDTAALSTSVQSMASDDIKIPPEPHGKCSHQLQRKIEDMYDRMRQEGLDLNRVIQSKKNFRNPSIYEKLIDFCHIDEKGTNFPPEIYDPHLWGKESFYDELDKIQRKDMERREKEKKERTKIEFVTGTKKAAGPSDGAGVPDEKKRKTKWDAQPSGVSVGVVKAPGVQGPGVVNLTATASGTKATVISALGSLSKKPAGK